jgi:hypothetical protein
MATKVVTGVCRLSFPHLFTPRAVQEGQEAKFSGTILCPKTDKKTYDACVNAVKVETSVGWPTGKVPPGFKQPIKDGDGMLDKNGQQRPETVGMWVINASSKTKPGLVDASLQDVVDKGLIHAGCFCRFQIAFAHYNLATSKGVGAYLNNVQFVKDGPDLGGREDAKDAFDTYSDAEVDC